MFVTIKLIYYSLMGKMMILMVWNNHWKLLSKVQLEHTTILWCATSTQNIQKITSNYEMH